MTNFERQSLYNNKDRKERRWVVYHELYIDVFFFVNFMMDYLLLLIVRQILKCSATHRNICIGSLIGSILTCLTIVIPVPYEWIKILFLHGGVSIMMTKTGLRINDNRETCRGVIALYTGSFLLGGVFNFLRQYIRIGSLFFCIAVLSYHIVQGIWSFISCLQRFTSYRCKVTLSFETGKCTVDAIIDTGNCLRDPVTKKPVCVLEKKKMEKFLDEERIANLRKIPFSSIGEKAGYLPVMEIKEMCVHKEKEYRIQHPVIGICGDPISANGGYGMILNPDIF